MASAERVVLITGVSRFVGARVAARLSADPTIGRIIGVDTVTPRPGFAHLGRAEFVRADIRNPLIGKMLDQAHVDTVVHPGRSPARSHSRRATLQDDYVAGTVQLLAACEQSATVGRVVAASSTAVYGASRSDPAVFTEDMQAAGQLAAGPARDAIEVENHLRAFARRRPEVTVSVLRLAEIIGPTVDSWLTRYLALRVVPTSLGYDPRLQFLHEIDAIEVFHRVVAEAHPGVTNVAADGVVTLTQVLRWAGRLRLPLPGAAIGAVATLGRPVGVLGEDLSYLSFGRVVDTTRLKTRLGYTPRYPTAEAVRLYLDARPGLPSRVATTAASAVATAQRMLALRMSAS